MTLLGPIIIGLFYGTIFLISYSQFNDSKKVKVAIHDPHHSLNFQMRNDSSFEFRFVENVAQAKKQIGEETTDVLLDIKNKTGDSVDVVAKKSLSLTEKQELKGLLANQYFNNRLGERGLSKASLDSLRPRIRMTDQLLTGKSSGTEMKSGVGYFGAFIIYLFIFMYGVMIMRGVTEEKNNRIVEIIISAVKPFELMMGKILGVALVGLTQFIAWIVLSGLLIMVLSVAFGAEHIDSQTVMQTQQQIKHVADSPFADIMGQLQSLNFVKILTGFVIFFFGGFLLYSSLFAAIGSAVDSDTETQQFMFPVSMPLIFGLIIAQIAVFKDPDSSLAVWCSMIPFTSPVVMMVRLPFDISWFEIICSSVILFGTFILVVWLAGKIYRIGILSYGQKASYKQLFKWMVSKS